MAAIMLYEAEDLGRSDWFSLDVGTVEGDDNIRQPQLSPKARHDSETVEWQMNTTPVTGRYVAGAIGIWGVRNFTSATVLVFSGVTQITGQLLVTRGTAVSEAHAIFLFDQQQTISGTLRVEIRKDLETFTADRLAIGYMQVYQALQDDEIADAGWSVTPVTTSINEQSQGGQIFGGPGSVRRQLQVNQGLIRTDILSGTPSDLNPIAIPAGVLTGGWSSPSTDRYTISSGASGTITLPNVLTGVGVSGKWIRYRIDVDVSAPASGAGDMSLTLRSEGGGLFIPDTLSQGVNYRSNTIPQLLRDDLVIEATSLQYDVTVDVVSLVSFTSNVNNDDVPPSVSGYPNLFDAIRSSGPDKPIGLILRSDDLNRLDELVFYGVPTWGGYSDIDGDLTRGGFSLLESL